MISNLLAAALLLLPGAPPVSTHGADGWAGLNGGTTGGAGAPAESVFVVHNRAELITALDNGGNRAAAKVVVVDGVIFGNEAADGRLLGEQDYAPGFDLAQYMQCFVGGTVWSDSAFPFCKPIRTLRQNGSNAEKKQIQITVPSNTTLVGAGRGARLNGVDLTVNLGTNIIIRNLTLESPIDYFTSWDPGDGALGGWNARFDAMSVVTGTNLWVDHCTFTDGQYPDSEAPAGFHDGQPVQRHDGLLDIEDGSDFVTVSYSQFLDHDKTLLIGSGDSKGDRDRGHERLTFHHNLFRNAQQRSPRLRFGELHSYNNYFVGSVHDPDYPMVSQALGGSSYFLGMGLESKIFSEFNAFRYDGAQPADIAVANLKGNQFVDRGSWVNGRRADLNAVAKRKFDEASAAALAAAEAAGTAPEEWATWQFTTDVGFDPAELYAYRPLRSAKAVVADVLRHAGAGRL